MRTMAEAPALVPDDARVFTRATETTEGPDPPNPLITQLTAPVAHCAATHSNRLRLHKVRLGRSECSPLPLTSPGLLSAQAGGGGGAGGGVGGGVECCQGGRPAGGLEEGQEQGRRARCVVFVRWCAGTPSLTGLEVCGRFAVQGDPALYVHT
jgi:hypothetical protein